MTFLLLPSSLAPAAAPTYKHELPSFSMLYDYSYVDIAVALNICKISASVRKRRKVRGIYFRKSSMPIV